MAYATSNPPRLIAQSVGAAGGALWWYTSTDAATVVRFTGYITDGFDLGMKVGDVVMGVDSDASPVAVQMYIVTSVATDGAADLSDGTAITATDTD